MNNGTSLDGNELREKIHQVDQRRRESLSETHPELAELICIKV